jgi:hypothetical protein
VSNYEPEVIWDDFVEGCSICEMNKPFGYYVEEHIMVCPKCANNPEYLGLLTTADKEGYPDGFTCNDCNIAVGVDKENINGN